jgi:hypothetical protein
MTTFGNKKSSLEKSENFWKVGEWTCMKQNKSIMEVFPVLKMGRVRKDGKTEVDVDKTNSSL